MSILQNIIIVYSEVFFLLPLPLLMIRFSSISTARRVALKVSFIEQLKQASGMALTEQQPVSRASNVQKLLAVVVWLLVILALSKPQWLEEPLIKEISQRDMLLAIDLSGSMETRDFRLKADKVNRLEAVKAILIPFLQQRQGERMGMIFFGSAAFVQAPFTTDLNALSQLLNEAQVAMAGPRTVLGDSIAMAVKLFEESKVDDRLLIVLTDGNDTSSRVPPEQAAKLAQQYQIKIITIAIGDPQNAGEHPIDKDTLQMLADTTGGQVYFALDSESLNQVMAEINRLSPKQVEQQTLSPTTELYYIPLILGILLVLSYGFFIRLKYTLAVRGSQAL